MRIFLIVLVAVVILGGGWYWYSSQQAAAPANINVNIPENTQPLPPVTNMDPNPLPPATDTPSTGSVKEFTVTGKNFAFTPATMTVKKGDTVKIMFKNEAGTHDLRVDGYNVGTKVIQGGAQETITFVADKAGSFEYYCSVGSHRQMGMKGTLTVTP